jgi:hypothetical protein
MKKLLLVLLVALATLPVAGQDEGFGQNKIVYDKFDWSIYRSTHFRIYFYAREKESLSRVASFAESAYDELSRELNYQIPRPIPLIFYATHSEFEETNTDLNFISEGIGAFALPNRDRIVLPVDLPDEKLQQLIQHELTHVFEFEILFQGNFLRAITQSPPQWFMEGLASYYGHDEDNRDRMVLRDAVLSDLVPQIAKRGIEGYFAYRFGHSVFDFIASEWGPTAVRDFVYEWRTNLSGGVGKVIKRSFDLSADDFDIRFRRYLRRKYLPILTSKGEPIDFGERFKIDESGSVELSPAPFPSGDFVAAISSYQEQADVVVLSTPDRKLYKNLTRGYTTRYEYVIAQFLTTGPMSGRDVAVSPDGNLVAAFVRRERGRDLMLFHALTGGIARRVPLPVDQSLSPTFSPDGKTVAFAGLKDGRSDIFLYSMDTGTLTNITDDQAFDNGPTFSPDGSWLYYSSIAGSYAKIFRIRVSDRTREQVTYGNWNDEDASISPDGARLYFTSDRDSGIFNIYSIDLSTGETWQHTDVVGGAFTPGIFVGKNDTPKLIFAGYYKRRFSLYLADAGKPFKKLAETNPPASPVGANTTARYTPAIEVALDPEKINRRPSRKLSIDGASAIVGVNTDGTLVSDSTLIFSDNLGDRRGIVNFQSISSYTDIRLAYFDLSHRLQYGATLFDTREYYIGVSQSTGLFQRDRRFLRETGALALGAYPLDRHHRLDFDIGYVSRSLDSPFFVTNESGSQAVLFRQRKDNDPTAGISFVGDTTLYTEFGPLSGSRYNVSYSYTPDLKSKDEVVGTAPDGTPIVSKHGGTLSQNISVDLRHYFKVTRRSLVAVRLFGARSTGNFPDVYSFGGFDTLRAYNFRSQIGNELAFGNFEYRFPLLDLIQTPIVALNNVRGRVFVDVGAANFSFSGQPFRFWNGSGHSIDYNGTTYRAHQLIDGRADYGLGFSLGLLGVDLHWDFARQWDFRQSLTSFRTSFYIGTTF